MSTETKTVGIRMARATADDVERVLAFMHFVEEYMEYGTHTPHNDDEEEESIVLDDSQFVEKLRELWGGRLSRRIGVDACYNRVINGYQVLHDNVADPDKDYLDWKPELAKQLIDNDRLEAAIKNINGSRAYFIEKLSDRNELLAKVCDYCERLAKRKRLPPWSIMGDITTHGSGVSGAIYEMYRRLTDAQPDTQSEAQPYA
jgi:hypothetical protein